MIKNSRTLKRGSVIQANENAGDWCGCLLLVEEVKPWGCMAGVRIPFQGTAYIRLTEDKYEYVGEAVLVPAGDEDEV